MRASIKKAIGSTVRSMLDSDLKSSFTAKELNALGDNTPDIEFFIIKQK